MAKRRKSVFPEYKSQYYGQTAKQREAALKNLEKANAAKKAKEEELFARLAKYQTPTQTKGRAAHENYKSFADRHGGNIARSYDSDDVLEVEAIERASGTVLTKAQLKRFMIYLKEHGAKEDDDPLSEISPF